jgi:hypothetical protein
LHWLEAERFNHLGQTNHINRLGFNAGPIKNSHRSCTFSSSQPFHHLFKSFCKAGYRNRLRCQGCALVTPFSCIDAALLAPFATKLRPVERRESGLSTLTFALAAFTPCSDFSVACFLHRCTIAVFKQADLLHVLDYSNSVLGDSVDHCLLRLTLARCYSRQKPLADNLKRKFRMVTSLQQGNLCIERGMHNYQVRRFQNVSSTRGSVESLLI